ncbi:hypothetical protein [Streptomyces sp. NPDC051546]|uniref:hypothetical protein n=1 Tax=Streptomyces sp. NPDC051546 TaxID=3365655 RepID=UPI0037944EB9
MKRSTTMTTALLFTGLTLFLSACTGGGGSTDGKKESSNSAASGDDTASADAAVKMRKCLRDNGIDAPDPKPGEDSRGMTLGGGDDPEAVKKAYEKCGSNVPGSGKDTPQETKDKALKTAKCMRDHGFDMPDPTFQGNGAGGFMLPEGADRDAFAAQMNKCDEEK